jgi:hypothetical protein
MLVCKSAITCGSIVGTAVVVKGIEKCNGGGEAISNIIQFFGSSPFKTKKKYHMNSYGCQLLNKPYRISYTTTHMFRDC